MQEHDDSDRISSVEQLREIYGEVRGRSKLKELQRLDQHCVQFISLSPFAVFASQGEDKVDVTPRGGEPGFVHVESDTVLLIPDWPGNRRIDTLQNILENRYLSILFMIPGIGETLRVMGQASIHNGADLKAKFETKGKLPITVIRLKVQKVFLHCGRASLRAGLWEPETWPDDSPLPSMGQMLKDQIKTAEPAETQEDMLARYKASLY